VLCDTEKINKVMESDEEEEEEEGEREDFEWGFLVKRCFLLFYRIFY
jgi:hypothetical protein